MTTPKMTTSWANYPCLPKKLFNGWLFKRFAFVNNI